MERGNGGEQEGVFERGEETEGEGRGILEERGGEDSEDAGKRVGEQDEEGSVPDSDECAEGVRGDDWREGGRGVVRDGLFVEYRRGGKRKGMRMSSTSEESRKRKMGGGRKEWNGMEWNGMITVFSEVMDSQPAKYT